MLYCTRCSLLDNDLTCIDYDNPNKQIIVPKEKVQYMIDFQEVYSVGGSLIIIPDILFMLDTREKLLQASLCEMIEGKFLGDIYYAKEIAIGSSNFKSNLLFEGLTATGYDSYINDKYLADEDLEIGHTVLKVKLSTKKFFDNLGVKVGESTIIFYKDSWYLSMACDCDKSEDIRVIVGKDLFNLDNTKFKVLVVNSSGKVLKELNF